MLENVQSYHIVQCNLDDSNSRVHTTNLNYQTIQINQNRLITSKFYNCITKYTIICTKYDVKTKVYSHFHLKHKFCNTGIAMRVRGV